MRVVYGWSGMGLELVQGCVKTGVGLVQGCCNWFKVGGSRRAVRLVLGLACGGLGLV